MLSTNMSLLTTGQALFVGLRYNRRTAMNKHISLWQRLTDVPVNEYLLLRVQPEFEEPSEVLFFTNENALKSFETWWLEYSSRFVNDEYLTSAMPTANNGVKLQGYPLRHVHQVSSKFTKDEVAKQFLEEWYWICEYTQDPVIWTSDFWLFDNDAEMVMFKLRGKIETETDEYDNLPF
jgi:hypothetical protein